eukprot:CAMPEP_0170600746 /NCGR_PEP_ID=MMETSP0224-20130122/17494_1 /TAXON_ID=285029 /ORGANISM="Togula jolla, Strain CCCM 725" /LENGTH=443 /DNA_ID=CAMNT_0010925483 /DNA_START=91 /DNA_END=1422 /DNA_ORIENTATION=+
MKIIYLLVAPLAGCLGFVRTTEELSLHRGALGVVGHSDLERVASEGVLGAISLSALLDGNRMRMQSQRPLRLLRLQSSDAVALRNVSWVHFPKAGTSFISTLWNYACGQHGLPLDLGVDPSSAVGCGECYDSALMQRYPKDDYCEEGILSDHFQTQHQPTSLASMLAGANVVGMFRKPGQRLIAAHRNGRHASGFSASDVDALREACPSSNSTAACFVRYPGIAGCTARMLAGSHCAESSDIRLAEDRDWDAGQRYLPEALQAIENMAFVGITEEWDESICLFHLMFGGRMSPAELHNVHVGNGHGNSSSTFYDEGELEGFVDSVDEELYQAALARFQRLKSAYVGEGSSLCTELLMPSSSHAPSDDSADLETSTNSCYSYGRQCGPLGDLLDCGQCPINRQTYDPSLTIQQQPACVEGVCYLDGIRRDDLYRWDFRHNLDVE